MTQSTNAVLCEAIMDFAKDGEWHFWTQFLVFGEVITPERATQIYVSTMPLSRRERNQFDNATRIALGKRRAIKQALKFLVNHKRLRERGEGDNLEYQLFSNISPLRAHQLEAIEFLGEGIEILRKNVDKSLLKDVEEKSIKLQEAIRCLP